jgi:hypothetical protein
MQRQKYVHGGVCFGSAHHKVHHTCISSIATLFAGPEVHARACTQQTSDLSLLVVDWRTGIFPGMTSLECGC